MGWDGSGNVVRGNGEFTGDNTWQQDLAADKDVTAARHDVHDEILADAIEKCLNRDGENAMTTDIELGGNALNNIGALGGNLTNFIAGTWTPVLEASTTNGTHTYGFQTGSYLRVGDLVLFYCAMQISVLDAAISGDIQIGGLPYANGSGSDAPAYIGEMSKVTFTGQVAGAVVTLEDKITIVESLSAGFIDNITDAEIAVGLLLVVGGIYSVT